MVDFQSSMDDGGDEREMRPDPVPPDRLYPADSPIEHRVSVIDWTWHSCFEGMPVGPPIG